MHYFRTNFNSNSGLCTVCLTSDRETRFLSNMKKRRKESWMTTDVPSYNLYKHVNSKLGRQHRKAAVAAAIGIFFMSLRTVPIQPVTDVTDM